MNISKEIQRIEGLTDAEVERLDNMLAKIEEANPSMPPEIYRPDATVEIDSAQGGQCIDGSLFTKQQLTELKKLGEKLGDTPTVVAELKIKKQIYDHLHDYVEYFKPGDLYSLDVQTGGWIAHLSMPGYMDQTDPVRYNTLKEAIEDLYSMYVSMYVY